MEFRGIIKGKRPRNAQSDVNGKKWGNGRTHLRRDAKPNEGRITGENILGALAKRQISAKNGFYSENKLSTGKIRIALMEQPINYVVNCGGLEF